MQRGGERGERDHDRRLGLAVPEGQGERADDDGLAADGELDQLRLVLEALEAEVDPDDRPQGQGELVQHPLDRVAGEAGLHARHGALGLVGGAGPTQQLVDHRHRDVQRPGHQPPALERLEADHRHEHRVVQVRDVVVVGELVDAAELHLDLGAQHLGEVVGGLPGEGLQQVLQHPDVVAGELGGPPEVVAPGLAATPPGRQQRRPAGCGSGVGEGHEPFIGGQGGDPDRRRRYCVTYSV
ncbi:hypothetical protein GCM10023162_19500 [Klenkia terrae]